MPKSARQRRWLGEIGVAEPVDWPPEYIAAGTRAWMRDRLAANPAEAGWMSYYILADIGGRETLAGICGFGTVGSRQEEGPGEVLTYALERPGAVAVPKMQQR